MQTVPSVKIMTWRPLQVLYRETSVALPSGALVSLSREISTPREVISIRMAKRYAPSARQLELA
jgi:hypothetical protein